MRVGRAPTDGYTQIVSMRERPYTVYRRTDDGDDTYGEPTSSEYTQLADTRPVYCFLPNERPTQTPVGEVTNAALQGLIRPDVDIRPDDRLDHGGNRYEVTEKDGRPGDSDPVIYELYFERV